MISVGNYIIVTSIYADADEKDIPIDTCMCYYTEGILDSIVFFSKEKTLDEYVSDYFEGMDDVSMYNIKVNDFSEIIEAIISLTEDLYDFEDYSVLFIWDDLSKETEADVKTYMETMTSDAVIQITKFKDFIEGPFTLEKLFINHNIDPTLYDDPSDIILMNFAQSELLVSLNSRG